MIGEYLKALRLENKLSQRALAEKSGVSNAEISRIESGERKKPSEEVLRALALVLKVDFNDIFEKYGYLYIQPLSRINNSNAPDLKVYNEKCEDKFISIITPRVLKDGFNMSLSKNPVLGNILVTKDNYIWRIRFIPISDYRESLVSHYLVNTYGYLACYDEFNLSKFTIATNNDDTFKKLKSINPVNLNILVSIMLVDLDNNEIIDEYIFEKTPTIDSVY
ncbi:helix-turn-helix domain-containing protein [Paraclostridium sordellii]|uniref:helix-turn-helix domain-containing protein n=1 Tax=Paraclostridium sordellii TaxID=1505 RepID=UPI0005E6E3D5|nr:helix-turn-helix domain-containing protein [Paeniclostridium sordellii]CEP83723.1 helix-turn-helix domain-containing protein [[Clostridium] sordellii] [Paeniclostridium sordellii]